jgi:hypothetical protein
MAMVQVEILTVVDNVLRKVFQKVLRKVFYKVDTCKAPFLGTFCKILFYGVPFEQLEQIFPSEQFGSIAFAHF